MVGELILHYKIIEELGRGGMGAVYKAEDTRLNRFVALKFLQGNYGNEKQALRLLREAQTAGSLDHPNICTVYNIENAGGQIFIVMAYIEGLSLQKKLESGALQPEQAADLFLQIAAGLREAHENGIIHRDIKSANIMLSAKGQVKITDFGLARWVHSQTRVTKAGTKIGTTAYMSPEQALGRNIDHRTDIWSLGVLFYEMLTGRLPFHSENEQAVIYAILNEEPESPASIKPDLPAKFDRIIQRALTKNPDSRYQTIDEMLGDLNDAATVSSGEKKTSRKKQSVFAATPKFRFLIWGALVLVLAILSYRLFTNYETGAGPIEQNKTAAVAVLPFSVRGNPEFNYLGEGMVDLLGSKFDGTGGLRTIDSRALLVYLSRQGRKKINNPLEAVNHFQASYYIQGNIVEVGGQFQIDASFYDAKNQAPPLAKASATGRANHIFDIVDRLAAELFAKMSIEPGDRLKRTAVTTTSSLPALKSYLDGERAFRAGQYDEALAAFNQAVAEDSAFALAFYRLSVAADWLTRPEISKQAAAKAVRHSQRLSERDRLLLDAMLAWRSGDAENAENLYRTIVGTYLEDIEALFQLGEVLFHYGPINGKTISAARKNFEGILQIDHEHVPALWHLARIASAEEKYDELNSLVANIRKLQPEGERLLEILTLHTFAVAEANSRENILSQLQKSGDLTLALSVWNVACYTNDFRKAEPLARLFTKPNRSSEANTLGRLMLAHLDLAAGKFGESKAELELAGKTDPVLAAEFHANIILSPYLTIPKTEFSALYTRFRSSDLSWPVQYLSLNIFFNVHNRLHPYLHSYLSGMLAAKLGQEKEALQYAEQLNITGDSEELALARDLSLSIRAQSAFEQTRFAQALQYLEQLHLQTWYGLMATSPFYSRAYQRFLKAEILFEMGKYEPALKLYQSFSQYSVYDLIYQAPAMFKMGAIFEKLEKNELAAQHYEGFINMWENCDPEFRGKVDEAGSRAAKLRMKVPLTGN